MTSDTATSDRKIRLIGADSISVWGITSLERLRRIGRRYGIADVAVHGGDAEQGAVLFVRGTVLVEDRLIAALFRQADRVLVTGTGVPAAVVTDGAHAESAARLLSQGDASGLPAGWSVLRADAPELGFDDVLRKRAAPYVLDLNAVPLRDAEWRMFGASYKGATDFVTKWLWPVPAFHATRLCAALKLTPNMVTAASFVLVLAAIALFWAGDFGTGIAAAWAMTFLDTVDGKLARVTVTSSKWGNVFDHGIDMIHPPFWYWAWWQGLGESGSALLLDSLIVIVLGYMAGRLIEGLFIAAFRFEMHIWRPFDYWLRAFTARRNPNLAILMAAFLLGEPAMGFVAVAGWTIFCLALHLLRLAQALLLKAGGRPVASFLAGAAP